MTSGVGGGPGEHGIPGRRLQEGESSVGLTTVGTEMTPLSLVTRRAYGLYPLCCKFNLPSPARKTLSELA